MKKNRVEGVSLANLEDVLTRASCQVVTVFLGSFLAGSLFSQFTAWAEHPASAITILGTSAPLTSIFFLNYISLSVCPPHSCEI